MKLLLTRHGETDWNRNKIIQGMADIPLNRAGLQQASCLAKTLCQEAYHVEHVYTSRLERASHTAHIVAAQLQLPCSVVDGLEEMNLGLWEGLGWSEVAERYPVHYQKWYDERRYTQTPEGESYQDVLARFLPALQQIAGKGHREVLVVTHSANLMTLLSYLNGTPFQEMILRYKIQNTALVELDSETVLSKKNPADGILF